MLTLIISILMSLGIINTPADYNNADTQQQAAYSEWVIEEDFTDGQ